MKPLLVPAVLVGVLLASIAVPAQQTNAARVCVYGSDTHYANHLAGQVNYSPQARYQRDMVVKYLNEVKAPTDARLRLEAVALTTQNRDGIRGEADTNGCLYLVGVTLSPVGSTFSAWTDQSVYEGYGASVNPPVASQVAPLTVLIMYHKSPHLWVSYPYGSYSQYKWSANDVAVEVHKTILKKPAP